jgi:hypothetical protein
MRNPGALPLVIPKPVLPARNLLAAGGGSADSSRGKPALRNDNSSGISRVHHYRNLSSIAGLLCLCFSIAASAQVSGSSSKPQTALEQRLIANTNAVPQAQKSKDVTFLKRTLTDDFVLVGSEGKLHDKEEIMESARDGELKDFYTYKCAGSTGQRRGRCGHLRLHHSYARGRCSRPGSALSALLRRVGEAG